MWYIKVVIIFKGIKYFFEFLCRIQASKIILGRMFIFGFNQNFEVSFFYRLFFRIKLFVLIESVLLDPQLNEVSKLV